MSKKIILGMLEAEFHSNLHMFYKTVMYRKNTNLCTKPEAVSTAISMLLENIQDEKYQPKLED